MTKYGDKSSGLKSLFGKSNAKGTSSSKFVSSASMDSLGDQVESAGYIKVELENKERVVPTVDFSKPSNFAKYGSAEQYYKTSIERIYKTYPYDGSKKEKIQWSLTSSYIDNYIFENEYPRTNGFISVSPLNGGLANSFTNNPGTGIESYTLATSPQYISVKGGPNQASLPIYDQGLNKSTDFKNPEHKANFYDTANNRAKNITIDGTSGNTIEFWIKSDGNLTTTKAVYDAWNSDGTNETQPGSASYGRMLLENRFEISTGNFVDGHLFHLTYHSGTTGAERVPLLPISVVGAPTNGIFDHFSITVKNSGNQLNIKTFFNGALIDNKLTGSAVLEVTGASAGGINANIGAYRTYPTEYVKAQALGLGTPITDFNAFGNMTASFDEFRVWKTARTESQVQRNWFSQVGAGTNTDISNTKLGFYFKFNEGIVGQTSTDQVVLDYSGRVSNGVYNNYSSTSRSTGSAMVLAGAAEREFKDPILYPIHPDVSSYKTDAMKKGEEWDYRNPSFLFNTLPEWIQSEDSDSGRDTSLALTQILASYFDTLYLQIQEMPKIKTARYLSSSVDVNVKPVPFASKLLKNAGFVAPEIFADTDVIAALSHRDDDREYEKKLYDIKNYIYQNIYNNLTYIYKSKGTAKSIRNLIRCFGVGEEIYKLNLYANNAEYNLVDNFVDKTVRKTYADFNDVTRNDATVYSYKNTSESNNTGYITGSTNTSTGFDSGMAMTVESEVILPRKTEYGDPNFQNKYYAYLTSSLFGMHSAKADPGSDAQTVTTWDSNDYANFQVYAVSDTFQIHEQDSKSVQFILKSYNSVLPTLTSSIYLNQYQDVKWNFAVRVKQKGYPYVGTNITGSTGKAYDVEFEGVSTVSDVVVNTFKATGSIASAAGLNFITQKKRLYVGAHRTNFTGSLREYSDAQITSCRYWADDLTSDELKYHSIDSTSKGINNPEKNAYLTIPRPNSSIEIPRIKTLILNWEFDTITGSDGSGQFIVKDSSYTINQDEKFQEWGVDLENFIESNHDARGDFFENNSTDSVAKEFIQVYKQQLPENLNDSNMITVAVTDDLTFTKESRPVKFSFSLEKSMYQTISEEMLNFFLASKEASSLENIVGDPVNRYRMGFKSMEKVRNLFYNTVGNTPDLEKYLNFYKWLDNSISEMVKTLKPASANLPDVRNMVENHLLERNKYQSKFPTLERKDGIIQDAARGINELTYDWKRGHAPIPTDTATASRTKIIKVTGVATDDRFTVNVPDSVGGANTTLTIRVLSTALGTPPSNEAQVREGSSAEATRNRMLGLINGNNGVATSVYKYGAGSGDYTNGIAGITATAVDDGGQFFITITANSAGEKGNNVVFTDVAGTMIAAGGAGASPAKLTGGTTIPLQKDNCFWWNKRALRDEAGLSSGDTGVDSNRRAIHSSSIQVFNRKLDTPVRLKLDNQGLGKSLNKRQFVFAETPPGTGKNVAFNTTTFSKPVVCDDTTDINPQFKFKPQFKVEGDVVGSRFQGRTVSPVVFYSSSVGSQNTDPTGYLKTTQHLQDYYVDTKDIPLQGPFTEQHVGGYQYRHTGLNIAAATTRKEGWYTTTSVVGGETYFIIYNPFAISSAYPRAGYSRDSIAKSPLNIKNIKNITSSQIASAGGTTDQYGSSIALGNYSHDYEIVQIPGRSINNKYFIENSGILTGSSATTAVRSVYDREMPNRGKNKYVFVSRFSAPGSPETMGAGYLDLESESFSVYNALPFRNLAVSSPLKTLLTRHSLFGGHDSVAGSPSASFQKTQRNGAKRLKINNQPAIGAHDGLGLNLVTGTTFDNGFVQHMIPQSDMQYAWITASATSTIFGYAQPNPANASMASTDITFVTASQVQSFVTAGNRFFASAIPRASNYKLVPTDFVGLNYHAIGDLTASTNTLGMSLNSDFVNGGLIPEKPFSNANLSTGFIGQSAILNAVNLNRNGAGGFSSWKQVRQGDHPLVRDMRKNNRMSFIRTQNTVTTEINDGITIARNVEEEKLFSYTEPPVSSKYKPLRHQIQLWNYQNQNGLFGPEVIVNSSYGNNLAYFTMTNTNGIPNVFESMTKTIGFQPDHVNQVYDDLKRIYIDNEYDGALMGSDPIKIVNSLRYRETVYPRESFTFLAKTRTRENYGEASGSNDFNRPLGKARTFWRDDRNNRLRSIGSAFNSMGKAIEVGTFKTTTYDNVIDLSCWPLEANYPMVIISPTGAGAVLSGAVSTGQGEGSLSLPTDISLKSLNGELSYNNWVYNLYRTPVQGLATSAPTTLTSSTNASPPPTASLSYEYPNFVLSGNDVNFAGSQYTISHLNLIPDWKANAQCGRNPWFDSYDEYSNDIRRIGKDYTVIPEFRISDHMDYYLKNGFEAENKKFMDLIGSSLSSTSSATSENSKAVNSEFFRIYSHTDFMKHFEVLRTEHVSAPSAKINSALIPSRIRISCKGIKKLLPYQGFYPALRTVQLGQMFSSSYGPYLTGNYDHVDPIDGNESTEQQKISSLIQPFFAPGIMFNTIKSGVAVDWPVITGSIESKTPLLVSTGSEPVYGYRAAAFCNFDPDWRMPFEALVAPNEYLPSFNVNANETLANRPDASIYHIWPNYPTGNLNQMSQARRYSEPNNGNTATPEEFRNWYDLGNYTRPSPNFAWTGEFDNRYNLAMNNFLAETIDFFLEDRQTTTFVSKPEKDFKTMVSGTTYIMDVVMSKTDGFKMYEGPDKLFNVASLRTGSSNFATTASVSARGLHYGPFFGTQKQHTNMGELSNIILRQIGDPGPAPYTPPYFYGSSVARIAFRPHALRPMDPGEADKFTLSEIFSSAEIETVYLNQNENSNGRFQGVGANRGFASASAAYRNQMDLKSSMRLFERTGKKFKSYMPIKLENGEFTYVPQAVTQPTDSSNDVWIMETKFECPTLNFEGQESNSRTSYSNGDGNERNLTTGMWKTFGSLPEDNEGIFLQIKDPFPQITEGTKAAIRGSSTESVNPRTGEPESRGPSRQTVSGRAGGERSLEIPTTGSLIQICGFDSKRKRVGEIASSKVISEAIIAIPINQNGSKVKIPASAFATQLNNLDTSGIAIKEGQLGVKQEIKETSVTSMIKKMRKYVIPPHLDFINNPSIEPFVMYIFEFNHKLTKNDLSLIWQNVMPDISVTAEEAEASIEHPVLTGEGVEFFGTNTGVLTGKDKKDTADISVFPPNLRWMVFKVKQRAKNNYFGVSLTQDENKGFGLEELDPKGKLGVSGKQLQYSYNWPYDFFSLVELAKVETTIGLEPRNSLAGTPEEPTLDQQGRDPAIEATTNDYQEQQGADSPPIDVVKFGGGTSDPRY